MIRKANRFDKLEVLGMMDAFIKETGIGFLSKANNEEWRGEIFDSLTNGAGIIFIDPGKGCLVGYIAPSVWCNKTFGLYEMVWYVKPEHRDSRAGYKLYKKFEEYTKELKLLGRVSFVMMGEFESRINYEKRGYKRMEKMWIKEIL